MGTRDIESWIASTEGASDDEETNSASESWETATEDWAGFVTGARARLLSSSTKLRIDFIESRLLPLAKHADLTLNQTLDVFKLVTLTYARYIDTPSRGAIALVGAKIVERDEARGVNDSKSEPKLGVADQVIGWLHSESQRITGKAATGTSAPVNQFVLLNWCCDIYTVCIKVNPFFKNAPYWTLLVEALAALLDSLLDTATAVKPSLRRGAVTRLRRALRTSPEHVSAVITTLLAKAKNHSHPTMLAPFLGLACDVKLHLKNVSEDVRSISGSLQVEILQYFTTVVLTSKTPVPSRVSTAFHNFIAECITEDDFKDSVLSVMEKASLRSPEIALPVVSDFFQAYPYTLPNDQFRRVLVIVLNSSKSSNPTTRSNAVALFRVMVQHNTDQGNVDLCLDEILGPAKAGKTTGPDHRAALYAMLSSLSPSEQTSGTLTETAPYLLAKENSDAIVPLLASLLIPHLVCLLKADIPLPKEAVATIVKEMTSTKPILRRSMCSLTGSVLWDSTETTNKAVQLFLIAVIPTLENGLKTVAANPLGAPAGPLEGYIALASLLGPLARFPQFETVVSRNTTLQSLSNTSSPKPSFLLWDKVYHKLNTDEERKWVLRALTASMTFMSAELKKSSTLRDQVGQVFIYLATHSTSSETRRMVTSTLEEQNRKDPKLTNMVVRESLEGHFRRLAAENEKSTQSSDEAQRVDKKFGSLAPVLLACAEFVEGDSISIDVKHELLAKVLIISHVPEVSGTATSQLWIDLCQRAKVDPHELIVSQKKLMISSVLDISEGVRNPFQQACYRAATTLSFVAGDVVLPDIVQQLKSDLDEKALGSITETDLAIWQTPEGTLYHDVLSNKHREIATKGKNAAIEKWEAELRNSLANKKTGSSKSSAPANLSKLDRELVETQLRKEAEKRQHVDKILSHSRRGLALIRSIVTGNPHEFSKGFLLEVVVQVLKCAVERAAVVVGEEFFRTFIEIGNVCSERLGSYRTWIGTATLRCINAEIVPEELKTEPLHSLVIRVLHRLRALSEQSPFDGPTFSYFSPLISHVISVNGISGGEDEELIEQIALCVDIIKFHSAEFLQSTYPREQSISNLLSVVKKHPSLSKEATSALVTIGEAIHSQPKTSEIGVLLQGILAQEANVRNASLQCLQPIELLDLDWSAELWITRYDNDDQNARLARHVWDENALDVPETFFVDLRKILEHENASVRSSCAVSLTEAAEHWPEQVASIVRQLQDDFREKAKVTGPEYDEYGLLVERTTSDPWHIRVAIAQSFEALAALLPTELVVPFLNFALDEGVLGDKYPEVRSAMLSAASKVVDVNGSTMLQDLISLCEKHLETSSKATASSDHVNEAAVILLGRAARHLNIGDERIPGVVNRLVEALRTPSEQVQVAVSECLAPLAPLLGESLSITVDRLFDQLISAPKYGERRGAAYGIAGLIKGRGAVGIRDFDVLDRLRTALEDKKRYEARQGAMFAIETLMATLGRVFEPYVIQLLPSLLASLGDSVPDVREAAEETAKVMMAKMSGYGVKLILPSLLSGLEEKQWRTKKGSIELLGSMAYCAPKQLSLSLPTVIPRLTGVLTDSHAQVRSSANKSLKQFGEVINNPEIQALVPVLLKALVDPAKAPNALTSLLKTTFAHYIDSPSLALVVPIIERGLRERGAEAKRKAAQIVGNLASLTDSKDFVPYLSRLLPLVHIVLVDPVPEARATAAKALGTLVERLGEGQFPDLVPSLLKTLKADTSGVDRQGAAQGLSEVLAGLGMERLEALLPDIVSNAQSPRSTVREGFMSLLVYLPATFGPRFQPHLPKIVNPILSGLSDAEEYVREAAMKAGRMIITNYSNKAIDLLLPELERGMFDNSWRIRHSSITLVGELLFKVSGISGKAEIEDDETAAEAVAMESSRKALGEALGKERRDRVLSALYIVRQDAVSVVRQSAIHIWKALVHNTPRTVRELLPELIGQLIQLLVDDSEESQDTAARTIGELCRKFGERILGEIIPILRSNLSSSDPRTRQGVCLALCEIMTNSTETQRESHNDDIVAMVRSCLVDDEADVRTAAAKAFDSLQEHLGASAADQTIPTLLEALRQPGESSETALQALREVMSVRAHTVFPELVPTLIKKPITAFNARALSSLASVAGTALNKRLSSILDSLASTFEAGASDDILEAVNEAIHSIMGAVADSEGLHILVTQLLEWAQHNDPKRRSTACYMFAIFCEESDLDDSLYRVDWIRQLVTLMDDSQVPVHTSALQALDVFVKSVPKDELEPLVVPLRRSIESTGAPGRNVPGFSLPKGVAPMVPILIAGLTTGSNEQRENAAYAIGDLINKTEENAIKPFVVPFTGPLIRVSAQSTAYPPGVKSAILSALTTMLEAIPAFVKPFFPQLQRTFVKAVGDPSSLAVRNRACTALGVLMRSQPRVDPVITELISAAKSSDDTIAASHVIALSHVIRNAAPNVGEKSREVCVELIADAFRETYDEQYMKAVAELFSSLTQFPDLLAPLVQENLLAGTRPSILSSNVILAVLSAGEDNPTEQNIFTRMNVLASIKQKVQESISSDVPSVARPAREAKELLAALEKRSL